MANPCKITFKKSKDSPEKEYSYEEFMAILNDGELQEMVNSGIIDPKTMSGSLPAVQKSEGGREPEIKERGWITSVKNDPRISDATKSAFTARGTIYSSLPNEILFEEAKVLVDLMGEQEAMMFVTDMSSSSIKDLPPAYRSAVAQMLIMKFNETNQFEKAAQVAEIIAELATEWGQAIQSFAVFKRLNPQSLEIIARKDIERALGKRVGKYKESIDAVVSKMDSIQMEAARDIARDAAKGDKSKAKGMSKKNKLPKSYGKNNTTITIEQYEAARKALLDKLNPSQTKRSEPSSSSLYDEIFTIASFHFEASNKDKNKFMEAMRDDMGTAMDSYMDMLYDWASEEYDFLKKEARVKKLTESINSEINRKEGPKKSETGGPSRLMKNAIELDSLIGGDFYTNYVREIEQEKQLEKLKERFEKTLFPGEGKKAGEKTEKGQKLIDMANEIFQRTGDSTFLEIANDYIQEQEEIKKTKAAASEEKNRKRKEKIEENKQKRAAKIAQNKIKSREKKIENLQKVFDDMLNDVKKNRPAKTREDSIRERAQELAQMTGDNSYVQRAEDYISRKKKESAIDKAVSERGILESLRDMGVRMSDLIQEHFENVDATREKLIEKMINQIGMSPAEADSFADRITDQFNSMVNERKQKALDKLFKKRKGPERKNAIDKIISLHNQGALDRATMNEEFAKGMGFPTKLTPEQSSKLKQKIDDIQKATGEREKERAMYEFLKYQQQVVGIPFVEKLSAVYVAELLSGPITQAKNIIANSINTASLFVVLSTKNLRGSDVIFKGMYRGIKNGIYAGADVLETGVVPFRGEIPKPSFLEVYETKYKVGPIQFLRFVNRFMRAADTFSYQVLSEMKSHQVAFKEAKEKNKNGKIRDEVKDILSINQSAIDAAKVQAEIEFDDQLDRLFDKLDNGEISQKEYDDMVKKCKKNKVFRINELIQKNRPDTITSKAHDFALDGTFNGKPTGFLGWAADSINHAKNTGRGMNFIVPFVNTLANVSNTMIDWTPLGFVRAARGGSIFGTHKPEQWDSDKKSDMMVKSMYGTILSMVLAYATFSDDEEPFIEVTSNGYNDYNKNEAMLKRLGWMDHSFRFKNPFTGEYSDWYSYKLTPVAVIFSFFGGVQDAIRYRNEKPDDSFMTKAAIGFSQAARSFVETTPVFSLDQFLNKLSVDERSWGENFTENITNIVYDMAKSMVLPPAYTQSVQLIEDWMNVSQKEIRETYAGRLLRDIPVARDSYNNKIGPLGEEIKYDIDFLISSVRESSPDDWIYNMLIDRRAPLSIPNRNTTLTNEYGEEIEMTDEEFFRFSKIRGNIIRKMITENKEVLSKLSDEDFNKQFNTMKSDATTIAKSFCTENIPSDVDDYGEYILEKHAADLMDAWMVIPDKSRNSVEKMMKIEPRVEKKINKSKLTTEFGKSIEENFQKYFNTLPQSLQIDDNTYDIRRLWKDLGSPESYDSNAASGLWAIPNSEEKGMPDISPKNGRIYITKDHPEYKAKMENYKSMGYTVFEDSDDEIYLIKKDNMPPEGPYRKDRKENVFKEQ